MAYAAIVLVAINIICMILVACQAKIVVDTLEGKLSSVHTRSLPRPPQYDLYFKHPLSSIIYSLNCTVGISKTSGKLLRI
ncbi:hypothetical protein B0F90DRAFT_1769265 [Multifurca ochricompacta]|uniref:Uncharacterized protein n=1 Tax=Multifurca ochricompacta TaxID=376703 RepID=A0AAD4LW10_9AGAM|nr:hypothetical protein B0F90DRAFT_1769265 [Multifurca ochricompacta]